MGYKTTCPSISPDDVCVVSRDIRGSVCEIWDGYVQEKEVRKPGIIDVTKDDYHTDPAFANVDIRGGDSREDSGGGKCR